MTEEEFLATYYRQASLSDLGEGFSYDTANPTYWNEKLAYMLCGLVERLATAEIKVSVERAPGKAVVEAISLVLPKISLRTDRYEIVIENEGSDA